MKRIRLSVGAALLFAIAGLFNAAGDERLSSVPSPDGTGLDGATTIVLFYSDNCPHCRNQIRWLDQIESDFSAVEFRRFDVSAAEINQEYFERVMAVFDSNPLGWPRLVIDDRVFIGFVPRDGELVYNEEHQGWIGYQNQIYGAIAALEAAR